MLSDDYIAELIACKKVITSSVSTLQPVGRHMQSTFYVVRADGQGTEKFRVFIRQSKILAEDYSVGLALEGAGGCILLRYNGSHQEHKNPDGVLIPAAPHIHTASEKAMKAGLKAEKWAETTEDYASFGEAQVRLLSRVNIVDWATKLTWLTQYPLFPGMDANAT